MLSPKKLFSFSGRQKQIIEVNVIKNKKKGFKYVIGPYSLSRFSF